MNVPELAELVRHRRPDIKIVLTSGYVSEAFLQSEVHCAQALGEWTRLPSGWRMSALEGTKWPGR